MPRKPLADANNFKAFALLAYKKHAGNIGVGLRGTDYILDDKLSIMKLRCFYNPAIERRIGNSLGEALATHVKRSNPNQVREILTTVMHAMLCLWVHTYEKEAA